MMNRLFLLTFLDVMKTGNFNRTAERLNITQSTVSARIKELEEELNVRLFERGRGGAEPTAAGRKFESYCTSAIALWTHACRDVRLSKDYSGELNIYGQLSLVNYCMLEWAETMRRSAPNVSLYFEVNFSVQIQRDVLAGKADIGIVFAPQYQPDLQVAEIGRENYVMLSTQTSTLSHVDPAHYIKVCYTPCFERYHDEHLPNLTHPPLSAGSDDLAIGFLTRFGGTLYLPNFAVDNVQSRLPDLKIVEDAPVVPLPIYSVVHIRKCHEPLIIGALKSLRDFMSTRA